MSAAVEIRSELEWLGAERLRPFDVHAHTGADIDGSTRSCEEHIGDLEAVGGRSVIFPLCVTGGYEAENRRVVAECARYPDRLVPFARLDPRVDGAAEATAALAAGARGFKLHPRGEQFTLAHPNVDAILAVASAAGVPALFHAGSGVGSFGPVVLELAARHRGCSIILAHAGISDLAWIWRELPDHPNLFFDTAWLIPADLLALFALVPPGRILYGSDAPYMGVELLLATTLRCARFSGLSEEAVALVAGAQLENLLAGEPAVDAGPAPGPAARVLTPAETRLVSLLSGAGGCMLGGGDPDHPFELALLATVEDPAADAARSRLVGLVEAARSQSAEAMPALVFALTLAMTPGVGEEALVA